MIKIPIKNPSSTADDLLFQKVNFIANVFFTGFSPIEAQIMCELIRIGDSGMVNLTGTYSKSITKTLSLNDNTLNVSLGRIEGKGAIRKEKRLIVLQPIWNKIMAENEYLICFQNNGPKLS